MCRASWTLASRTPAAPSSACQSSQSSWGSSGVPAGEQKTRSRRTGRRRHRCRRVLLHQSVAIAAYNGTAPAGVSSGNRKIYRLSPRGNRRASHAIHMAAITQIRYRHSTGRACYDRKVAEGKTHKEVLRCLKRRISDAMCARLQADARHAAAACTKDPGGQPGNDTDASAASSHPGHRLFGQATPESGTILRPVTQSDSTVAKRNSKKSHETP